MAERKYKYRFMTIPAILLCFVALTLSCSSVLTTETESLYTGTENEVVMTVGSTTAYVSGNAVENDVTPIVVNDRTMLPARFVAENLGASVTWNDAEKKITIEKENISIVMFPDSATAYVNSAPVLLDSAVFIKDGRTYTPVRFIAENLGASVKWLDETKQVVIDKTGKPIVEEPVKEKKPAEVYVKTVAEFSKTLYNPINDSSFNNKVRIPQISGSSSAVLELNRKIMEKHGDVLDILSRDDDIWNHYVVDYYYKIYNGVVGLIVLDERSTIGSFHNYKYYGYYYDANNEKELTYLEYLTLLDIDRDVMINNINRDTHVTDPLNEKVVFDRSYIFGSIYDGKEATAVVDFYPHECTDFKYEVTADVLQKSKRTPVMTAEYNLAEFNKELNNPEIVLQRHLNKYCERIDSYYKVVPEDIIIENTYLADVDNDRMPELCVKTYSRMEMSFNTFIFKYVSGEIILVEILFTGAGGSSGWSEDISIEEDGSVLMYGYSSGSRVTEYNFSIPDYLEQDKCITYTLIDGVILNFSWYYENNMVVEHFSISRNNVEENVTEEEYSEVSNIYYKKMEEAESKFIDERNCSFYEIWNKQQALYK